MSLVLRLRRSILIVAVVPPGEDGVPPAALGGAAAMPPGILFDRSCRHIDNLAVFKGLLAALAFSALAYVVFARLALSLTAAS
jgi:hypothetical protein